MDAIRPLFKIEYNGKNITEDISKSLIELTITDNLEGQSDSIEIVLEDVENNWSNGWYPEKGAAISLSLGYDTSALLRFNAFQIDEIALDYGSQTGDVVTIKAISAGMSKRIRTKRSSAHENKTLREIVSTIASQHGLTVVGEIEDIVIGRVTQRKQNDISFLARLADEYGYYFTIKDTKLIFTHRDKLESVKVTVELDRTDMLQAAIRDKSISIYSSSTIRSHDPTNNKLVQKNFTIEQVANNDKAEFSYLKAANNSIVVPGKTENASQADAKAKAALHKSNTLQQVGRFTFPGMANAVAGINMQISGFGKMSGVWHALKVTHRLAGDNSWTTEAESKRVITAARSSTRTAPKKIAAKATNYKVVAEANKDNVGFTYIRR